MKQKNLRTMLAMLMAGAALTVTAQNDDKPIKRIEHNLYTTNGFSLSDFDKYDNANLSFRVGYGLNTYINPKWSIMTGIGWRAKFALFENCGMNSSISTYFEVPLLLQYHLGGNSSGLVLEAGPVFAFLNHGDPYDGLDFDIDYDEEYPDITYKEPYKEIEGKEQFKKFELGFQPSVYYETSHGRFGLRYYIGMTNSKKQYAPYATGSYHSQDISLFAAVHF